MRHKYVPRRGCIAHVLLTSEEDEEGWSSDGEGVAVRIVRHRYEKLKSVGVIQIDSDRQIKLSFGQFHENPNSMISMKLTKINIEYDLMARISLNQIDRFQLFVMVPYSQK